MSYSVHRLTSQLSPRACPSFCCYTYTPPYSYPKFSPINTQPGATRTNLFTPPSKLYSTLPDPPPQTLVDKPSTETSTSISRIPVKTLREWTPEENAVLRAEVETAKLEGRPPQWTKVGRQLGRSIKGTHDHWKRCLDITVTKGPWTKHEVDQLQKLVLAAKGRPEWTKIGQSLNRSGVAAQMKWDQMGVTKGRWSKNEDDVVIRMVQDAVSDGLRPSWSHISSAVNRSLDSAYKRWRYYLDPSLKMTEEWSEEEDETIRRLLIPAFEAGKPLPCAMVGDVLSRSRVAVRYRWLFVLKPNVS